MEDGYNRGIPGWVYGLVAIIAGLALAAWLASMAFDNTDNDSSGPAAAAIYVPPKSGDTDYDRPVRMVDVLKARGFNVRKARPALLQELENGSWQVAVDRHDSHNNKLIVPLNVPIEVVSDPRTRGTTVTFGYDQAPLWWATPEGNVLDSKTAHNGGKATDALIVQYHSMVLNDLVLEHLRRAVVRMDPASYQDWMSSFSNSGTTTVRVSVSPGRASSFMRTTQR